MSVSVMLADDHRIVRDGLRSLLAAADDLELVGEAEDGLKALELSRRLRPDVLVADLSMPGLNGIELVRRMRAEQPAVRVLSLSVHDEERLVLAMIEAGACGYVLKEASFLDLVDAIRQVMAGRVYLSPALVGIFVQQYRGRALQPEATGGGSEAAAGSPREPAAAGKLTGRERELVQLFSEGHSTQEIAERLHVSAKTVATHRENIQRKLGIAGIAEMTRYALREGISSLDVARRPRH